MITHRKAWTPPEQLTVLRYYLQTPFGRLHAANPEIQAIATQLGRTANSIAMKGSNYASLDPRITSTGRRGLSQTSRLDREVWALMESSFEAFEEQSAAAAISFGLDPATLGPGVDDGHEIEPQMRFSGDTENEATVTIRRKQDYFRRTVLAAYRNTCPITGITISSLLNASHIIPWNADTERRLDPCNGIALNALHDRAFDRGLISFRDDLTILVSSKIMSADVPGIAGALLQGIADRKASRPDRFQPDPQALEYHRDTIFVA